MVTMAEQFRARKEAAAVAAAAAVAPDAAATAAVPPPPPPPPEVDMSGAGGAAPVEPPPADTTQPQTMADKFRKQKEAAFIEQEEAALRAQHAATPEGRSAIDLTTDIAGVVLNPVSDLYNYGREALGMQPAERMTDVIKDTWRNSEAGFKAEQGARVMMAGLKASPSAPAAIYGLGAAVVEAALTDRDFAEASMSDEGRAIFDKAVNGDPASIKIVNENPTSLLRTGLNMGVKWDQDARAGMGVAKRANGRVALDEEIYGIIGQAFVGLPEAAVTAITTSLIRKLGTSAAVRAATKLATSPIARAVAKGGEMVLPGTFPLTPGNVAANAGVDVALQDVMLAATGQDTAIGGLVSSSKEVIEDDPELAVGGGLAASVALGAAMLSGRTGPLRAMLKGTTKGVITGPNGVPTKVETGSLDPIASRQIETEVFDADAPIMHIIEDMHGKGSEAAETVKDTVYLNTRNGGEARINASWEEGKAPGKPGTWYSQPGSRIVQASEELSVKEHEVLSEGMIAESVQWDIQNGRGNGTKWTPADLTTRVNRMRMGLWSNPRLKEVYDSYKLHMREVVDEMHGAGLLSDAEAIDLRARPYVPHVPLKQDEAPRWFSSSNSRFSNQANSPFAKYRAGEVADFENPFKALSIYEPSMTKQILENRTRGTVISTYISGYNHLKNTNPARLKEILPNGSAMRLERKGEGAQNVVEVWHKGQKQRWVVGDPQLRNALQFNPHSTWQLGSSFRRTVQIGTTGEFNPLFAAKSLSLDLFFGSTTVKRHEAAGYMDYMLHRTGLRDGYVGNVVSAAIRPVDATLTALAGIPFGVYNHVMREMTMQLDGRLGKTSLAGIIPEPLRKRMSARMTNRFHKSLGYQMEAAGYAPGRFGADMGTFEPMAVDRLMRTAFDKNLVGRTYRGMLNTVREAYRLQLYAINRSLLISQGVDPHAATKRATRLAREAGSDPTRAGQNADISRFNSSVPYANVSLQALGTLAKTVVEDRNGMSGMVLMSHVAYGMAASAMIFDMGGGEWWYEKTTDRVRVRNLPINPKYMHAKMSGQEYTFDPKDVILIDVGPEVGTLRAVAQAGIETMLGFDSPLQWNDPAVQTRMKEAGAGFQQLIPFGVPSIVNFGTSVYGTGPVMEGKFWENQGVFTDPQKGGGLVKDKRFTGADQNAGIMTDKLAEVLSSVTGTAGRQIAEWIEQGEAYKDIVPDASAGEVLDSVLNRATYDAKQSVSTMWNKSQTPTKSSPTIERAYDLRRQIEPLAEEVEKLLYGVVGQKSDPIDMTRLPMRLPKAVQDPVLRAEVDQLVSVWNSDDLIGDAYKRMSDYRTKFDLLEARRDLSPAIQKRTLDSFIAGMEQEGAQLSEAYSHIEAGMKGQYGEDWSLSDLTARLKKDLAAAPPDVRN